MKSLKSRFTKFDYSKFYHIKYIYSIEGCDYLFLINKAYPASIYLEKLMYEIEFSIANSYGLLNANVLSEDDLKALKIYQKYLILI
jgi:hypothetical protein